MSFRHPHSDPRSERLLMVVLEEPDAHSSDYRHIRATVIRRAAPHKILPDAFVTSERDAKVEEWNDDYPSKCIGYRVASYQYTKTSHIYVDDMQLRGQIDAYASGKLNQGRPYGNRVSFTPHQVEYQQADAMCSFFRKYASYMEKHPLNSQDDFSPQLERLANFLGISRFVFYKPNVQHTSLESTHNLVETNLTDALAQIKTMLKPFAIV